MWSDILQLGPVKNARSISSSCGTGIRGLVRGKITSLKVKVGRLPGELEVSKSLECDISLQCFDTVGWATGRASGL